MLDEPVRVEPHQLPVGHRDGEQAAVGQPAEPRGPVRHLDDRSAPPVSSMASTRWVWKSDTHSRSSCQRGPSPNEKPAYRTCGRLGSSGEQYGGSAVGADDAVAAQRLETGEAGGAGRAHGDARSARALDRSPSPSSSSVTVDRSATGALEQRRAPPPSRRSRRRGCRSRCCAPGGSHGHMSSCRCRRASRTPALPRTHQRRVDRCLHDVDRRDGAERPRRPPRPRPGRRDEASAPPPTWTIRSSTATPASAIS